ncbi:MAG: hypothetical protein J5819_08680 [Eubacterium sp.]|nr:hypothetical protein [Eubacterium sp.]
MKKRLLSVMAVLMTTLTLIACGAPEETAETEPEPTATAHGIDAPGFERTMITADRINNGEVYVHGEDGYYLLAEHGANTKLKAQVGGTCWANAAASSMESNFLFTRGEEITVDPYEIVDVVYDENKKEGLLPEKFNKMEFGGLGWFIMEVLSNGFGDYVLTAARNGEELTRQQIKDVIMTYGSITMGMSDQVDTRRVIDGYFTQYGPEKRDDHEVAIVGWDDHFPKRYFNHEPPIDGAWIVQDSLINSDYCYMSYDSPVIDTFQFELSDEYGEVLAYEAAFQGEIRTGDCTTLANVFHKKGTLAAVGTYIPRSGEPITIRIVDEDTGETLLEQSETYPIKGYYATPLEHEIPVENYRVEIKYRGYAPVEGDENYYDDGMIHYHATIKKGQSYVKIGDTWYDMATKAARKMLGIKFKPHNACIKALYA